jgi:6-phosphogluconolactonase
MTAEAKREVQVLPDPEAVAVAGAAAVTGVLVPAGGARVITVALAGGHTPRRLYELLADLHQPALAWDRIHLVWGDERCVPPDDPASNFAMAEAALLRRVPIPPQNVHRMPAEITPPARAAARCEATLRGLFDGAWPGIDLVLLGVGPDGHTASLFPGQPALDDRLRWVTAVEAPATPPWRLTLTLPVLNAARTVIVLATGAEKAPVVRRILRHDPEAVRYPAAMVDGRERTLWLVDRAAAGD